MDQSPGKGPGAAQDLAPRVYAELRRLAGAYMRRERPGQTLQATALVHEVYLRLAGAGTPWQDERHFVGIAARSMRQILVEAALDRGTVDVGSWLNSQTTDTRVRAEVLSLLEHHSAAGSFLANPVVERMPDLLADEEVLAPGATVGPYTIIRELGRGGMGR